MFHIIHIIKLITFNNTECYTVHSLSGILMSRMFVDGGDFHGCKHYFCKQYVTNSASRCPRDNTGYTFADMHELIYTEDRNEHSECVQLACEISRATI